MKIDFLILRKENIEAVKSSYLYLTVGEFQESPAKYIISREDKETFSLNVYFSLTGERPEEQYNLQR